MNQIYQELMEQKDVRSNLSNLRQMIKEQDEKERVYQWVTKQEALMQVFLSSEDAKTRKNAALLIGDLSYQPLMEALWEAYNKECTLFVKSSYLTALAHMDVAPLVPQLKERQRALLAMEIEEENRKHINEELHALRDILIQCEGIQRHTFDMKGQEHTVLLTANRTHREIVRRALELKSARLHPLGVMVFTDNIKALFKVRSFREVLFTLDTTPEFVPSKPRDAADILIASGFIDKLKALHKEDMPFYFRIECKSRMTLEERSSFTKKLAEELERLSNGTLINSTSDYEIELRLIENKEGNFFPCIKCTSLIDNRFRYRKNAISASIHPATAALLMELAQPYFIENAQIMDPFCGVGTMLIERNKRIPAKEMYATDIFGDAIEKGRENAAYAQAKINFIHRDFFDFKHDYLFDEIITNMPMRGKKTREEMDALYEAFFNKVLEITHKESRIIMYTNEIGFVKKQLRLQQQFALVQETCIQEKTGFYLLVIEVKGEV